MLSFLSVMQQALFLWIQGRLLERRHAYDSTQVSARQVLVELSSGSLRGGRCGRRWRRDGGLQGVQGVGDMQVMRVMRQQKGRRREWGDG
jgi:hypothetical protein